MTSSAGVSPLRAGAPHRVPLECVLERGPLGPLTLRGYSRAADGTSFTMPELGWMFDAGLRVDEMRPDHIWLSHTHSDHCQALMIVKSRRKPPRLYVPEHAPALIEHYVWYAQQLTNSRPFEPGETLEPSYLLEPLAPGMVVEAPRGRDLLRARVVECDHSVPTIGCLLEVVRKKLKVELRGVPGPTLEQLRRLGVEVMEEQAAPLLAYLYDTTPLVYERHPEVLRAPYILTECTFIRDEHIDLAAKTRHTHWRGLEPYVREHTEVTFILGHLSMRYEVSEIIEFFASQRLSNVVPWVV
jgi:ribonuclease Z